MVELSLDCYSDLTTHHCIFEVEGNIVFDTEDAIQSCKTINLNKYIGDKIEIDIKCIPIQKKETNLNLFKKIVGALVGSLVFFSPDYYCFDPYCYDIKLIIGLDSQSSKIKITINESKESKGSDLKLKAEECSVISEERLINKDYHHIIDMFSDFYRLNYIRAIIWSVILIPLIILGVYYNNISTIIFPMIILLIIYFGGFFMNKTLNIKIKKMLAN